MFRARVIEQWHSCFIKNRTKNVRPEKHELSNRNHIGIKLECDYYRRLIRFLLMTLLVGSAIKATFNGFNWKQFYSLHSMRIVENSTVTIRDN